MRRMSRWGPFVLAAVLLPHPAPAQQERHVISGDRIAVYNLVGEMRVQAGTGADVVVSVTRGGRDAARLRTETGPVGDRQALRVIYPEGRIIYPVFSPGSRTTFRVREDGTFGGPHPDDRGRHRYRDRDRRAGHEVTVAGSGEGTEAYADITISVPAGRQLAVYLGAGKATIGNVDGQISVDASSASVTADGVKGTLSVDVGSGSVHLANIEGETDVDTGSGSVDATRVRGSRLGIDTGSGSVSGSDIVVNELGVETGSGSIDLTQVAAPTLDLETGSGDVRVALTADVEHTTVETGSGEVVLSVPATLGAEIMVDTGSGGIESDIPLQVTRWGNSHLTGRIGDGLGRIDIETGSGEVRLRRAS